MRGFGRWLTIVAAALLPVAAGCATQPDLYEPPPGLDELAARMRARLLQPGERVPNWDVGGADPEADLRALGADSHYIISYGEDGDDVSILTERPIAAFVPAAWRVVDSYGSAATPLDRGQVSFTAPSRRYVIALRSRIGRRGRVNCELGYSDATLYEVPGAPAAENDDLVPLVFLVATRVFANQVLCARSEGTAATGYRSRIFLPDGRPLPDLRDENEVSRIVPAAPIEQLVTWRPRPPPLLPEN